MKRGTQLLLVLFLLLSASQAFGQDYFNFEDDRIIPMGARAVGTNTVELVGNDYVLKFVGDETIEYRIDRTHIDFANGMVRLMETSSGAMAAQAGQQFKYNNNDSGGVWLPGAVYSNTNVTALSDSIIGDKVVIDYQHVYSGVTHQVRYEIGIEGTRIILLNTRQDRLDRARQLADLVGRKFSDEIDFLFLIGQSTEIVESMAIGYNFPKSKIINLGWTTPAKVFEKVLAVTPDKSTILAVGNMGGMGAETAEYFKNRSTTKDD